ncbi:2-C-methyl-D-erythritol 4-phosphate cytidylyltransferase [Kocuria flava]|uniref:2-C-methyl-D-erythritol 4-phosphate cytidylyltransferase n=1 Tax=Kocuria flava TaxID=446860 RepID=A0A0U3G8N2_9MICC|nr:2-C-methyl-D-erythritol 4-phosphate cytidylyltransferase [Kocuria flava]ALU39435.1 2-C-methyl-D-erythritol 4-phosphate cytidylyltransferase [Kocuria flava]GEO92357.1 2-C-methyl-D-erythritol 4-phosphate cytidylyltransferase [Kocuria flava]
MSADAPTTTADPPTPGGFAAVVVAAGSGTRLGHGMPKALVPLGGRPLLAHALEGVRAAGVAGRTVVTVPAGDTELSALARACGAEPVEGGATRAESVRRALAVLAGERPAGVLVHDAARCLTPPAVLRAVADRVRAGARAVVPVVPVVDTVRRVDDDGRSLGTVDRSALRAVQTPQGFDAALLRAVHAAAEAAGTDPAAITDDASLVEAHAPGTPVETVPGHEHAFKVTRPLDLLLAQALLEQARDRARPDPRGALRP